MNQAYGLSYSVRIPVLGKYFGQFCMVISALTLVPLGISLLFGETHISLRYFVVIVVLGGLGAVLSRIPTPGQVQDNEGMALAALLFLFTPVVMSFPIMASGLNFLDALFEAISGTTTTGLSMLASVEDASPTFLFARAWMQWYGGLGIVVLSLALIVRPGIAARGLAVTETKDDDLVGGTKAHAHRALKVYAILTGTAILILLILGAKPFHAVIYSLASVSTGGFSPHDNSVAGLGHWSVQAVVILFGLAGAIPLAFYHPHRRRSGLTVNALQLRAILASGIIATGLMSFCLWRTGILRWPELLLHSPLLAFSAQSTAGFSTMDLKQLDSGSKLILILVMATGGGIGSTAGGVKILRFLIATQLLRNVILRTSLPKHAIVEPRLGSQRLLEAEIRDALLIIFLFVEVIILSWLPFVAMGYAALDSLFEVVSATGTVGLSVGITSSGLPALLKGVLCFDMLLGRLEIVAWMVFLNRKTWMGRRFSQS